jgi:hypothetical protein
MVAGMMRFVPILVMIRNYILGGLTGRAIGRPVIVAAVWIISGLVHDLADKVRMRKFTAIGAALTSHQIMCRSA